MQALQEIQEEIITEVFFSKYDLEIAKIISKVFTDNPNPDKDNILITIGLDDIRNVLIDATINNNITFTYRLNHDSTITKEVKAEDAENIDISTLAVTSKVIEFVIKNYQTELKEALNYGYNPNYS